LNKLQAPAAPAAAPVAPKVESPAPKVIKPAVPVAEPTIQVIETVTQVGGGAEIMKGWESSNSATVSIPLADNRTWEGIQEKDGKTIYIVAVSSDPGSVSFNGKVYSYKDKGFVAVFITADPESISMITGFNEPNNHFNNWAEKYIVPTSKNVDEVAKQILSDWEAREKKPVAFAVLTSGEVYTLK
jgi:hypothetical protein